MFKALRTMADVIPDLNDTNILDKDKDRISHILIIIWDENGNFFGAEIKEFKTADKHRYFYNPKSGTPPIKTPTFLAGIKNLIEDSKKESNYSNYLEKVVKEYLPNTLKNIKLNSVTLPLPVQIIKLQEKEKDKVKKQELEERKNEILQPIFEIVNTKVKSLANSLGKKLKNAKILILYGFKNKKGDSFDLLLPGDIPEITEYVKDNADKKGTDEIRLCPLCSQMAAMMREINLPKGFTFFTVNNESYVTRGVNKAYTTYNFPMCVGCFEKITSVILKLQSNAVFKFANGDDYYLIPEFLFSEQETMTSVINLFFSGTEKLPEHKYLLHRKSREKIESQEEEILDILKDYNDIFFLHFLFIKRSQSRTIIKLYIPDVYPSRLKELFYVKDIIDNVFYKDNDNYKFTYNCIVKPARVKVDNSLVDNTIYKILHATFQGISLEEDLLFEYFVTILQNIFPNPKRLKEKMLELYPRSDKNYAIRMFIYNLATDMLASYYFIYLTTKGGSMEEIKNVVNQLSDVPVDNEGKQEKQKYAFEELYNYAKNYLDNMPLTKERDDRKVAVLIGALVGKLLMAQQMKRKDGSMPFFDKIRGFELTAHDMMKLATEALSKLQEYNRISNPKADNKASSNDKTPDNSRESNKGFDIKTKVIIQLISEYSMNVSKWNMRDDELNFLVLIGIGQTITSKGNMFPEYQGQSDEQIDEQIDEQADD